MSKILYFSVFLIISLSSLISQDRGLVKKTQTSKVISIDAGRQYALLIGINKYREWIPLSNPVKDVTAVRDILKKKYYIDEFIELYDEDATKANILGAFEKLMKIIEPHDSLFVFYAGHGHLDDLTGTGFWIPVDGGTSHLAQENWLPNSSIRGIMKNMKSRHILLLSDSCFSGELLTAHRGNIKQISNEYFRNAYSKVSRQILTSGASETVPDQSEFAVQLKHYLEGNTKPYADPLMMFTEIRSGMTKSTPMFGTVEGTGHQDGASFLLFSKEGIELNRSGSDENTPEEMVSLPDSAQIQPLEPAVRTPSYSVPAVAAGSALLSAGVIAGGVCGGLWYGQYYYRTLYENGFSDFNTGKSYDEHEILMNAEYTNNLYISALAMIPVSAVLAASGIISLSLSNLKKGSMIHKGTGTPGVEKYRAQLETPVFGVSATGFAVQMKVTF